MADPANREFITSVTSGECPTELEPADRRTKVVVNLARSANDFKEPEKPRYKAFAGTGRTLTGAPQQGGLPRVARRGRRLCTGCMGSARQPNGVQPAGWAECLVFCLLGFT